MNNEGKEMSAVVEIQSNPIAIQDQSTSLIQVIERAARDPSVDIDKMERLMLMHERIQAKSAQAAYAEALAEMQPRLPIIGERGGIKNRDGIVQSRYALWEDIVGEIAPVLSKSGFALSFRTSNDKEGVTVTGVLSHRLGHSESTSLTLPIDTSGSKNSVQSVGSSTSYGKRYTASALLNLRTGEIDNDGGTLPINAPDGYDKWKADIEAVADEGTLRLQSSWKKSAESLRVYATTHDAVWWSSVKIKAEGVKP